MKGPVTSKVIDPFPFPFCELKYNLSPAGLKAGPVSSDLLCFGTLNIGKALPFFEIPQISILPLSSAAITSPLFDTVTLSGSVNTPFPLYRVLQVLF